MTVSQHERVGIVGSRRCTDRDAVEQLVAGLEVGTIVVSGGCRTGPDAWAAAAARRRGLEVVEHLPDLAGAVKRWEIAERHYARNQRVVDDVDRLVAFVAADRRGGTEDTIKRAELRGIPVTVCAPGRATPPDSTEPLLL